MKLAKRFDILGDPAAFAMEFEREAIEVIEEADRRLALGRSTKALRQARERAERNGLALVQQTSGASALERWGSLASGVYWIEQLERQMDNGTKRTRDPGAKAAPTSAEVSTPQNAVLLKAFPGNVSLELDAPGHRTVIDLRPDDARGFAIELIEAAADATRMGVDESKRLH
ncbi:MAG: hypothetical protein M3O91_03205 [Chloroflexota bacterium]|nr:hypothetical protein [Chloroflexota bacterium]